MNRKNPFHPGEVELQDRLGLAERMERLGRRIIRDFMPDEHRAFFAQLPFMVLGTVDPDGAPWATLVAGPPGFARAPTPTRLRLAQAPHADDPAFAGMEAGAAIGLLGIELPTRRRNRLNGVVERLDPHGFDVAVRQSFGNCPRFIRPRGTAYIGSLDEPPPAVLYTELDRALRVMIACADTFFVASCAETDRGREADVSHRGGPPGFVRIGSDGTLTIPDYAGNRHFNTLGNLMLNPRAGLVFPDFATGSVLHMTGTTEVIVESDEIGRHEGAERLWRFAPSRIVYRPDALPLRFTPDAFRQTE